MNCVIVVEDNDLDFERIQRLAVKLGLDVDLRWAKDGLHAMTMLRESDSLPIGLVVDLNMPRMGGWELIAAVRADERFEHLPVAVCTTSAHSSDLLAAREAEVSAYIVKPIEQDELRLILNGFQNKNRAVRPG